MTIIWRDKIYRWGVKNKISTLHHFFESEERGRKVCYADCCSVYSSYPFTEIKEEM